MKRRTAKYVDALDTAVVYRLTKARKREGLYGALEAAGWRWDSIEQRWIHVLGPASAGWGPSRPASSARRELPEPAVSRGRPSRREPEATVNRKLEVDPFRGMPTAQAASDLARIDVLEVNLEQALARIATLERSLALVLATSKPVLDGLGDTFGIDLVATPSSR